ncbi:MAG: hypothetical protein D6727_03925 [Gammaproteobacteria bacterium]|nr:MAG: hypothetical protein D6727_03925 [Gammaproteobacteria bacterium]
MPDSQTGLSAGQFWILNGFAGLALVLVLISTVLFFVNRAERQEANARQQYINETVQYGRLNTQVAQFLAQAAVQTGDQRIRELLAANGITVEERKAGDNAAEAGGQGQ